MSRLSGSEEAIVALIKLLRGSPPGNQVDIQQTIAPAEVYAQALTASLAAWQTVTGVEYGPTSGWIVAPAGYIEWEIYNSAGVDRVFTLQTYINGAWRTVLSLTVAAADTDCTYPYISYGTNMRFATDANMYARMMRLGA